MTSIHPYNIACFCFKVRGDAEVVRQEPAGSYKVYVPLDRPVDLYHDHTLFAMITIADSVEQAERITLKTLRNMYPEADGYAGHSVCAVAVKKETIEEMLTSMLDLNRQLVAAALAEAADGIVDEGATESVS